MPRYSGVRSPPTLPAGAAWDSGGLFWAAGKEEGTSCPCYTCNPSEPARARPLVDPGEHLLSGDEVLTARRPRGSHQWGTEHRADPFPGPTPPIPAAQVTGEPLAQKTCFRRWIQVLSADLAGGGVSEGCMWLARGTWLVCHTPGIFRAQTS